MSTMQYIRQKDGTFLKVGEVKTRYIYLRVLRNGIWKEPLCPLQRTVIQSRMDDPESPLPAEIYELVGIESTMTEESKDKLKEVQKRKLAERGLK